MGTSDNKARVAVGHRQRSLKSTANACYNMKFGKITAILLTLVVVPPAQSGRIDVHAYLNKAETLIEEGEYGLARAYLNPAVISHKLTPAQRSGAYYLRGYSFQAQGLFTSAAKDFANALEFNPENPAPLYAMGGLHHFEPGLAKDPALALQLFLGAADQGHPGAQLFVGNAYLNGKGTAKDLQLARSWLTKAAEAGVASAMTLLASSYRRAHTDAPEPTQARYWYEQAVAAGDADALLALGFMLRNRELEDVPANKAINYFQGAAEQGSGPAMAVLAHAYMTGRDVPKDFALARSWYRKAAELAAPGSFAGLGYLHEAGLGVPASAEAAESWYAKGARAGHTEPFLRLLYLLAEQGRHDEAAQWARHASETGNAAALNGYARMLATSRFPDIRDGESALRHARRAVELDGKAAYLDTLAAAYAELNRFDDAIAVQRQALNTAGDSSLVEELSARLSAYEQAQPWRE